jgi:hypothetical protein
VSGEIAFAARLAPCMDDISSNLSPTVDQPGHVVRNFLLSMMLFLVLEAAVFRSGFYPKWLAPDSYAGRIHHFVNWTANHPASGDSEIALMGDSRVAEGFSAKIADSLYADKGIRFFNLGMPGASLRVQFYLLRQVDPHCNRFNTIALALDNYDDLSQSEDLSNREMDLRFVSELVGYEDAMDFPSSFPSRHCQIEAAATCLLKGHAYKLDLQDFLQSPRKRLNVVNSLRDSDFDWAYEYTGGQENLGAIKFDGHGLTFPPHASQQQIGDLQGRLAEVRRQPFDNSDYRHRWLGRIVDRYRDRRTELIVLQMPRGPFNWTPPHHPATTTIDLLRTERHVNVFDREIFGTLERAALFRDSLHLNHDGREAFSKQCAALLVQPPAATAKPLKPLPTAKPSLWVESEPGRYEAQLEGPAPHLPLADGFYDRGAGVNNIKPEFWFSLPDARGAGVLKLTGYMHPLLARLLPITVTAQVNAQSTVKTMISKDGFFEIEIACAAPVDPTKPDRITFTVDKSLSPKAAGINDDARALSVGIVKIEFLAKPTEK